MEKKIPDVFEEWKKEIGRSLVVVVRLVPHDKVVPKYEIISMDFVEETEQIWTGWGQIIQVLVGKTFGIYFCCKGKILERVEKGEGRHHKIWYLERLIFRKLTASNIGVNVKQWELSFIADSVAGTVIFLFPFLRIKTYLIQPLHSGIHWNELKIHFIQNPE